MNHNNRRPQLPRSAVSSVRITILVLLLVLLGAAVVLAQSPRSPQIVGGQEADPGEWPWQVALVQEMDDLFNAQTCGGALIAADWVLTAAFCLENLSALEVDVVAGVHDLNEPEFDFQRRGVAEIIIHPDYDALTHDSDIALLRLESPIDEQPAENGALPIAYLDLVPAGVGDLIGANVTVTGWGNRAANPPGGSDFPSTLHEVVVPVVSNSDCAAVYGPAGVAITDNMLCAGTLGVAKDACEGDEGGPVVYNNDGTWQLAGIVGWSIDCANPEFYGIYTRVSALVGWVNSTVGLPVGGDDGTYLPVVLNVGDGSPPPPPTPTPTPPPDSGFVNGDFEAGRGVGWTEESTVGYDLVTNDFQGFISAAHGGEWAAWLGGGEGELSIIGQEVTIPAAEPVLSFYHLILSGEEECGNYYDLAVVAVDGVSVQDYDLCPDTQTEGWVHQAIDLSAYAGQTVNIQFKADNDASNISDWFIDDVSFVSLDTALQD